MEGVTSPITEPSALRMGWLPDKSTIWGTDEVAVPSWLSPLKAFIIKVVHSGSWSLGVWPGRTCLSRPPFWTPFLPGRDQGHRNSNYCPEMTASGPWCQPADLPSGRPAAYAMAAVGSSLLSGTVGRRMEEGLHAGRSPGCLTGHSVLGQH